MNNILKPIIKSFYKNSTSYIKTNSVVIASIYVNSFVISTIYMYYGGFYLLEGRYESKFRVFMQITYFLTCLLLARYRFSCICASSETKTWVFSDESTPKKPKKYGFLNEHLEEYLNHESKLSSFVCSICNTQRPPRSHHCKRCNKCILKMDHHCEWLNICIGLNNQRQYYIFLYLCLIYNILTLEAFFIGVIEKRNGLLFILYIISIPLGIINVIFLLVLIVRQTYNILRNETTLEAHAIDTYINKGQLITNIFTEGPMAFYPQQKDRTILNPYNIGWKKNLQQVFGTNPYKWLGTSMITTTNGFFYPKNTQNIIGQYLFVD